MMFVPYLLDNSVLLSGVKFSYRHYSNRTVGNQIISNLASAELDEKKLPGT